MANPRKQNGHRRRKVIERLREINDPCWICQLPIDVALPPRHPYAMECDELIPVSKGGSPTDFSNVAPAHRCCNNWRRNRPVAFVETMRGRVRAALGAIKDPLDFVDAAKQIERAKGLDGEQALNVIITTDW